MELTLFNFSKRSNSTKRPSGNGIGKYEVNYLYPTSIHNPSITLSANDISTILTANYAKLGSEYFWIEDIIADGLNHATLKLNKDVLASFKTEIGNTSAKVLYSSSNYDITLPDMRSTLKQGPTITTKGHGAYLASDLTKAVAINKQGSIVLGVLNGTCNGVAGGVTYYIMDRSDFSYFSYAVLGKQSFLQELQKEWTNASNSLVSCHMIPFFKSSIPTVTEDIQVGSLDTNISGEKIAGRFIDLYWGKLNTTLNDYTDSNMCTSKSLYLPFVGQVPFDLNSYLGQDVYLYSTTDIITGDMMYILTNSRTGGINQEILMQYPGNCRSDLPFSGSTSSAINSMKNAFQVITGGITASMAGTADIDGVGGIFNTVSDLRPNYYVGGSASSNLGFHLLTHVIEVDTKMGLVDDIEALKPTQGLPCMKVLKLNTLSGYLQTSNASLTADAPQSEIDQVNGLLNGGIYYE